MAPPAVLYLQEYAKIDPQVRGSYVAVSSRWLEPPHSQASAHSSSPRFMTASTSSSPEREEFVESENAGDFNIYHLEDNRVIEKSANLYGPYSSDGSEQRQGGVAIYWH